LSAAATFSKSQVAHKNAVIFQ